nr:pepsinogen I/II major glycopeptide [Macaca fuscata]
IGIGTPQAN